MSEHLNMNMNPRTANQIVGPFAPSRGKWHPLGLESVRISQGYWANWQSLNATTMIEHCESWIERLGWSGNFDAAVEGRLPQDRHGREFSDSEIYKLLEAMSWEVARTKDQRLEERLRSLTARVAAVQDTDGYISTMFGRPGQKPRYSDLTWGHELYCMGHLIQAGVARGRTAGLDDPLTQVATNAANHICTEFGEQGRQGYCGHPEVEVALVELTRLTGDPRYLNQARLFIARRGNGLFAGSEIGPAYFQDDMPVREARVLRGHAVRALYLTAGVVDQAIEDDDRELASIAAAQMRATLARRTYVTGGMGSRHEGEAFGEDWELPSDRAYCESCAGVASIMVNHRLLLATGDVRFADAVERTLFNVIAASPAPDGHGFFYANPLRQTTLGTAGVPNQASLRASTGVRAPWFEVSCCPTNLTRTFASLGAYIASCDPQGVQIHQYAGGDIAATVVDGTVRLHTHTDYPKSGRISVVIEESPDRPWALSLRVPAWADGATITRGGETTAVHPGYAEVAGPFAAGEEILLDLPVRARWTWPDPRIDDLRGQVCVERGPVVMALESVDLESVDLGADVGLAVVRTDDPPVDEDGQVNVPIALLPSDNPDWPYHTTPTPREQLHASEQLMVSEQPQPSEQPHLPEQHMVPLIPYATWATRGPSTMRVWMPVGSPMGR